MSYWDHPGVPTGFRAPGSGMATTGDPGCLNLRRCMRLLVEVGPQELSHWPHLDSGFTAHPEQIPISKWHAQGSGNPDCWPVLVFCSCFFTRCLYFQYEKKWMGSHSWNIRPSGPATGLYSWAFPCLPAFSRPFNMGVSFKELVAGL